MSHARHVLSDAAEHRRWIPVEKLVWVLEPERLFLPVLLDDRTGIDFSPEVYFTDGNHTETIKALFEKQYKDAWGAMPEEPSDESPGPWWYSEKYLEIYNKPTTDASVKEFAKRNEGYARTLKLASYYAQQLLCTFINV